MCLSSLLAAERYQQILDLLEQAPSIWWEYRRWGVQALVKMGKTGKRDDIVLFSLRTGVKHGRSPSASSHRTVDRSGSKSSTSEFQ